MNSQIYNTTPAHSLYILYETLSNEMQQLFLQELITYQAEKIDDLMLYLALNKTKQENDFLTDSEAQIFIESLPECTKHSFYNQYNCISRLQQLLPY